VVVVEAAVVEVAVVALVLGPTLVLMLVELSATERFGELVVVVGTVVVVGAVVVVTVPFDVVGGGGAFGRWAAHAGRARPRLARTTKASTTARRGEMGPRPALLLGNSTGAPLIPTRRWRRPKAGGTRGVGAVG